MSKILVTGGAGFIGTHLVNRLRDEGHSVRVMDIVGRASYYRGDVKSLTECKQFCHQQDTVYHLAALKDVAESVKNPELYNENNIQGTANILEAARLMKVKRVIFASSAAVYGNPFWPQQYEHNDVEPLSPYAISKVAGENYCRYYSRVHKLPTMALRFFNVYGPGQKLNDPYAGVITAYINQMLRGKSPRIDGDGYQTRDFVYISDIVQALTLAIRCPLDNYQVCNVGVGQTRNLHEIINVLNLILDKKIEGFHAPEREGDVKNSCASIEKAKQILGYYPEVFFGRGMSQTVKYFQEINNV